LDPNKTARIEQIVCECNLSLSEFADALSSMVGISAMEHDSENESEWASTTFGALVVSLSRSFDPHQLHEWYPQSPLGCNYSLTLVWSDEALADGLEQEVSALVPSYASALSGICGGPAYHIRTWTKKGNVTRAATYSE